MAQQFSSGLRLADLDDFITPSQACIKPEIVSKNSNSRLPSSLNPTKIELTREGKYIEIGDNQQQTELEDAQITLNDCLACSGCVTSAESIFITAQSTKEFLSHVGKNKEEDSLAIISIAPQCTASLAAYFNLGLVEVLPISQFL